MELGSQVASYLQAHSVHETEVQRQLRDATLTLPGAMMQILPEQGQLLAWLIRLTGAKRVLELGAYTGYSALTMALALPSDGHLVTCDIDARMPAIGSPFWKAAAVSDKITLRIAPALDTLATLSNTGEVFDFAFIDADKANYLAYYQAVLSCLRREGLIVVDNVLWGGDVADTSIQNKRTQAIRELNDFIYTDPRVDACMLPIGDGLTLVRKR